MFALKGVPKIYLLALFFIASKAVNAQYLEFVENKGQWDSRVKFRGEMPNGAFYLQSNGYKVVLHNKEDFDVVNNHLHGEEKSDKNLRTNGKKDFTLRSHAYEVNFLNANPNAEIVPEKIQEGYSNYFIGNDPSKWITQARTYTAITYKNIYPNVDVRYYTDNGRLKYDIIAHPGADVNKIALKFDGADKIEMNKGNLIVKTTVDDVREMKPYSYQLNNYRKKEIGSNFEVKGNIVRFKLTDYDKTSTLVIDPVLIFSTFSGSKADNWGFTATYDGLGNFYGGGIVFGEGFPVSNGAFQTIFQGGSDKGHDIGIIKLSADGSKRLYATYIGGNGNEQPHSLIVDAQGNLIMAGRSSSTNFPTTLSTYGPGGGTDIVLVKLNANGTGLIASRKFGGTAEDGINIENKLTGKTESTNRNYGDDARSEVLLDPSGDIYLASCTQSTNFQTTAGAPQTSNKGGTKMQDGVLIKTSSDLSTVKLSTYLGGDGNDACFVLALNPVNSNIYVAGATASTNFPGVTPGVKYSSYQGGDCDGFVSILTNTGQLIRSSYFGTSGAIADIIYGIQFDKLGFPYITGTTMGSWPVVNAPFSQAGGKQFIAKLQPDLSDFVYSTTFGAGTSVVPNISIIAFLVDRCENVYVSGWGGEVKSDFHSAGTTGMSMVNPVLKPNGTDGKDFYFFVLAKNATSQLYGDFFGQNGGLADHVDGGTSRFDKEGVIYQAICGNCAASPKPAFQTTYGSWSPTNPSPLCNLAMLKIAFNLAGVGSAVKSSVNGITKNTGCIPMTVDFTDTVATGKQFKWLFGDGSAEVTTTEPNVQHTYTQVGTYNVRLISIDSSTCNIADTSYTTIIAKDNKATPSFTATKLLPCESLNFQFTNTSTAPPAKPFTANSFKWDFGDGSTSTAANPTHSYAAAGTYLAKLILIDTNYCNSPDSAVLTLRIATNVKAQFETPPYGCVPYNAVFNNTSLGGQQFVWDFGDGGTSTDDSPTHLYTVPGTYTIKMIATDTSTCNKIDSTSFTITVSPNPTSVFFYSPDPPLPNTPVVFGNQSLGGNLYKWSFGDGDSLVTKKIDTAVTHIYNDNATFQACLAVYNQYGCIDTSCQPIVAKVDPLFDVPTAFTPNGDGRNDKIYVRAYGVKSFTWRIFNRWGNQVYVSTNFKEGWDGTYNGKLQPQDVYTYVVDIELVDGKKSRKSGDITLLR
jgi:gliding motility-associated-like protein